MTQFIVKRIYDPLSPDDGYRVLVDRLWPRGISKESAKLDAWEKNIAPSTELRQWFNHNPAKFGDFLDRYIDELVQNPEVRSIVKDWRQHKTVTLLYGAKDTNHNNARALKIWLDR